MRLAFINSSTRASFTVRPSTHWVVKDFAESPISRAECNKLAVMTGLNTFNSKCPCAPPTVTATWLPMTWAQTMVMASHCVGFTFPGMIELPGSFAGNDNSPSPQRGPLPKRRRSFAILFKLQAIVFKTPETSTNESCAASASNLFGAVTSGKSVAFANRSAMATSYPILVFKPVPTAVPPNAKRQIDGRELSKRWIPYSTCWA
mmetsp:Transcript_9858/g.20654  ORF Transcript_9858/g.20654 Transcript_9858/m.20654 type:complete len:204 (+) Transcript_9858:234-845(+)